MNYNLKLRILERFGNQYTFGQLVKMHDSKVSKVIHGRQILPKQEKKKWAEALDCKIEEIFPKVKPCVRKDCKWNDAAAEDGCGHWQRKYVSHCPDYKASS